MYVPGCWTPLVGLAVQSSSGKGNCTPQVVLTVSALLGAVSTVMGLLDILLFSGGGTFASAMLQAYALLQRRGSRQGATSDDVGDDDGGEQVEHGEEEGSEAAVAADAETDPQKLSLKGFPGAEEESEKPDADNAGLEGVEDGKVKHSGSVYRLVHPADLYSAAGIDMPEKHASIRAKRPLFSRDGSSNSSRKSVVQRRAASPGPPAAISVQHRLPAEASLFASPSSLGRHVALGGGSGGAAQAGRFPPGYQSMFLMPDAKDLLSVLANNGSRHIDSLRGNLAAAEPTRHSRSRDRGGSSDSAAGKAKKWHVA